MKKNTFLDEILKALMWIAAVWALIVFGIIAWITLITAIHLAFNWHT